MWLSKLAVTNVSKFHVSKFGCLFCRRWWDAALPVPCRGGHTLGRILPRERVLDHYNSHVLRCPACQEGLRDLRRKQAAAQVASEHLPRRATAAGPHWILLPILADDSGQCMLGLASRTSGRKQWAVRAGFGKSNSLRLTGCACRVRLVGCCLYWCLQASPWLCPASPSVQLMLAASSAPVSGGFKFVADALSAAAAGTGPLW